MTTVAEAFAIALSYLQAGRAAEAEEVCSRIVAADGSFADAWHLLGVLALQQGNLERAVGPLSKAVAICPTDAEAQNNLGTTLKGLGRAEEAIESFRRATELRSDFAEAHYNLATALLEQGSAEEAAASFRRAIACQPNFAEFHNGLGGALRAEGKLEEALASYRQAIALQPALAEAHYNQGCVLQEQKQFAEAIVCYRRAVELKPQHVQAHCNMGSAWQAQGKWDEAIACHQAALSIDPQLAEGHYNLAIVYQEQGNLPQAMAKYRRAIELATQHANANWNLALLTLLEGNWQQGWPGFEWRWKIGQLPSRHFAEPQWAGESLAGKTILLHAEQGFGDTFLFIRYASLVQALGARVIVECQPQLSKLLTRCPGIDCLLAPGDDLPPLDYQAALLSLPGIFGTTVATVPADVPYLFADPVLVDHWRQQLEPVRGFRIGINWHGREGKGPYQRRDVPLECFAELAKLPGVKLISLQRGAGQSELSLRRDELAILHLGDELDKAHGAFMDTAAIMRNVDLVISTDTSIAHLAGGLGVPVWTPLPFLPEWRWLLGRSDSPWYPTMRLFRQKKSGDWNEVFEEIREALAAKITVSHQISL